VSCLVQTTTKAYKKKACHNLIPVPKKVVYDTAPFLVSADGARCVISAVPDAGCFYSSHEKWSAPSCQMDGKPVGTKHYIPLDIAWLLNHCDIPWLVTGHQVMLILILGFVKENMLIAFWLMPVIVHIKPSAWKAVISHQEERKLSIPCSPITVLQVNQAPGESQAPLPPDVFLTKKKVESIPANIDVACLQYKAKLEKSPSSKWRCCHYVAGALHRQKHPTRCIHCTST